MPEIAVKIKPFVADKLGDDGLRRLGESLIRNVEEAFGLQKKEDVVFNVELLCFTTGEDVQVKILFTIGTDEYNQGKPFNPTSPERKSLLEATKKTLRVFLAGITDSSFVWTIPIEDSDFSDVYIYPEGYKGIDEAPMKVPLNVIWFDESDKSEKPKFGRAIGYEVGWYKDPKDGKGIICKTPIAWRRE